MRYLNTPYSTNLHSQIFAPNNSVWGCYLVHYKLLQHAAACTFRLEMCLKTKGLEMASCLLILSFMAPMKVWYTVKEHTLTCTALEDKPMKHLTNTPTGGGV